MKHCIAEAAAAYGRSRLEPLGETGASTSGNADTWRLAATGSSNQLRMSLSPLATHLQRRCPSPSLELLVHLLQWSKMMTCLTSAQLINRHTSLVFKRKQCQSVDMEQNLFSTTFAVVVMDEAAKKMCSLQDLGDNNIDLHNCRIKTANCVRPMKKRANFRQFEEVK